MTPLLTAIQSAFTSATSITTVVTGGLHNSEAAEKTAYPFAEYDVLWSTTDARFGTNNRPFECDIQFKVFDTSATGAMTGISTITAVFDDKELSLGSGRQFFTNRIDEPYPYRVPKEDRVERDTASNPVYAAHATYHFAVTP